MQAAFTILISAAIGTLAIIGVIAAIDWFDQSDDDEYNPWR